LAILKITPSISDDVEPKLSLDLLPETVIPPQASSGHQAVLFGSVVVFSNCVRTTGAQSPPFSILEEKSSGKTTMALGVLTHSEAGLYHYRQRMHQLFAT
jgi:hypothetical protein